MQILLTPATLDSLLTLLEGVRHLEGAICELGVYQGGALNAMAHTCPEKACYGFDTFTGQPRESWREGDFHKPGEFSDTSLAAVRSALPANVFLRAGLFPDSANGLDVQVCFAHVDFDLEISTEDAIEWLRPRMVPGGLIVFDDYRWKNCPGVEKAIVRAGLQVARSAHNQVYWTAP